MRPTPCRDSIKPRETKGGHAGTSSGGSAAVEGAGRAGALRSRGYRRDRPHLVAFCGGTLPGLAPPEPEGGAARTGPGLQTASSE